jgi:Ca2+-binding EF-hand superfamily protein
MTQSQISKKQLVSFGSEANFDTVWHAVYGDHNRRFEMEGQPIAANTELVIYHKATGKPLSSLSQHVLNNDFGPEFELCCYPHSEGKRNHELTQEFRGVSTSDIVSRGETLPNRFAFLTASSIEQEALLTQTQAPQQVNPDALLNALRDTLCNRFGGPGTIIDLGRRFRISDRDRSGKLSMQEFANNLAQIGFHYNRTELEALCSIFDSDGNGQISYQEFLRAIRGDMTPARREIVEAAFNRFDRDGSGAVQVNDMLGLYDASWHPEVKEGKRTAESVFAEFLANFETVVDGKVTREEFAEYYTNLSAFIDTDEYFVQVVRGAWKL